MKFIYKIIIICMLLLNGFMLHEFTQLIIPVQIIDYEYQTICGMVSYFKIPYEVAKTFYSHGKLKNIDPILLASIAVPESNHNPNAISSKGYRGRMQSTKEKLKDSVEMLNGTEDLLEFMSYAKGNLKTALAMYNGGMKPPQESYKYADTVLYIYSNAKKSIYGI
jgi:hypothetical protein